jgi:catechol 2,3-dioxygenase-like lactoylglutathione lyase family enzyme
MSFTGLFSTTYCAPNLKEAKKFFSDWGLRKVKDTPAGVVFETSLGCQVILRSPDSPLLPKPAKDGMNFREMVWGVSSKKRLKEIRDDLARDREVTSSEDGSIHTYDPAGIGLGFRVWNPPKATEETSRAPINSYDRTERIDEIGAVYQRAVPLRMGHIGFLVPNLEEEEKFYRERLGFWLSDRYVGGAAFFLRCAAESQHHNLFMIWSEAGVTRHHHTAYEVRDFHEVFGGGVAFDRKGWETEVGPGRHPISSAYFWYFKNPCEGAVEYYTDSDYLTADWKPHNYRVNRFSEWHLVDGIPLPQEQRVRPSMSAAGKH